MKALWSDARKGSYHNAMAISQTLPALQQRSYLHLKDMECLHDNGVYSQDTHNPVTPIRTR